MKNLSLSQAIAGFALELDARRLSPYTIADYSRSLRRLQEFLGDPPFAEISAEDIRRFMSSLSSEPQPQHGAAIVAPIVLSNKSLLNIHTGLGALWTWAVHEGITQRHVVHEVARPKPEEPAIVPFTQDDLQRLLAACERTAGYTRPGKRLCDNKRRTALRDRALLLLLLDTGIRASELAGMKVRDVDVRNRRITVTGKGRKSRMLPISPETAKAIWKYLTTERADDRMSDPLFVADTGEPVTRLTLLAFLKRLGKRAGVPNVHPHRFRHTFAVQFLRNGGNAFELQMALGHTSLGATQTYMHLAQADLEKKHREASPVAGWRLGRG
jgi:site-specific recombinase XerD